MDVRGGGAGRLLPGATRVTVPGGTPFLRVGGGTACVLVHGFTAMPAETEPLGDHLAGRGHTVLGVRLAGHGTDPADLARTRWQDWLVTVEEALSLVAGLADRVVLIGQSLGGMVALLAAARYEVAGVAALSTPFTLHRSRAMRARQVVGPRLERKPVAPDPLLGLRREAGYPAYAAFPVRIGGEIERLAVALREALPAIAVPVFVLHSTDDPLVPASESEQIHALLGSADRRLVLVHGLGHSVVLDPGREVVFDAVAAFVDEVAARAVSS